MTQIAQALRDSHPIEPERHHARGLKPEMKTPGHPCGRSQLAVSQTPKKDLGPFARQGAAVLEWPHAAASGMFGGKRGAESGQKPPGGAAALGERFFSALRVTSVWCFCVVLVLVFCRSEVGRTFSTSTLHGWRLIYLACCWRLKRQARLKGSYKGYASEHPNRRRVFKTNDSEIFQFG